MFSTGPLAVALVVALAILGLVSPPAAAQCSASAGGCSTGGGKIIPPGPSLEEDVTFGFEFHGQDSALDSPKGTCLIVDRNLDVTVHCFDAFAYVQIGPSATIFGTADVNSVLTLFQMDVTDGADTFTQEEPDTFAFVTQSGYAVAGVVSDGNIDVHP